MFRSRSYPIYPEIVIYLDYKLNLTESINTENSSGFCTTVKWLSTFTYTRDIWGANTLAFSTVKKRNMLLKFLMSSKPAPILYI